MHNISNRAAIIILLAISSLLIAANATTSSTEDIPIFTKGARILFQGDSITDGNRGRTADPNHILGHGYVFIIAAKYGADFPDRKLDFLNRGISGNTVADLTKRWQNDTISLKPNILSILIGINDINQNVPLDRYEQQYDKLLDQTIKKLPGVRLVLCEPFGLPVGRFKAIWDKRHDELLKQQVIVAKLAEKYHAPVVHFQKVFDDACQRAPAEYWIWDGVHPTYRGHQLMADEWVRTVRQYYR